MFEYRFRLGLALRTRPHRRGDIVARFSSRRWHKPYDPAVGKAAIRIEKLAQTGKVRPIAAVPGRSVVLVPMRSRRPQPR